MEGSGEDKLAKYIVDDLFKWFKDERQSQLEPQMRRNYDAFRGKYNSDALKRWKATEGNDWRSKVFVRLTKQKVVTGVSHVLAYALQNGRIPWDIKPSPISERKPGMFLPEEEAKRRCALMKDQIEEDFIQARADRTYASAVLERGLYGWSWLRAPLLRPVRDMEV